MKVTVDTVNKTIEVEGRECNLGKLFDFLESSIMDWKTYSIIKNGDICIDIDPNMLNVGDGTRHHKLPDTHQLPTWDPNNPYTITCTYKT